MDSFFGGSKSSLHETVRAQQDRLAKYEKKLGDLVKAYKMLQEEKKALQDTVNVFSSQPPTAELEETSSAASASGSNQEANLRHQVAALTKTLSSLNETKNTLESRYQHDRKELLEQIENLKSSLSVEQSVSQRERNEHELQLKEMKSKLRKEQHEREQEQTHHVAMLRELQHMLAAERNSNQKLELELDDTRTSNNFEKQRSLFEEKVKLLQEEKTYLSREVEKARVKSNEPTRDYLMLEKEVTELRSVRVELEALKSERENSAHHQLHLQTTADQTRIRDLENRLTDLSELIADYDATQKRDQEEIARLQKRVSTLESESSIKTPRRSVSVSVNTNIVVTDAPETHTGQGSYEKTESRYDEISTVPLQLVTKNREAEISKLKDDMKTFKLEISKLQDEKKQQQINLVSLTEQHKQQLVEIAEQHTLEMTELDKGQSLRLSELLESSTKARVRSQELLAERDEEITELKSKLHSREKPSSKEGTLIGELLSNVETDDVPRTMIFYKQQHQFLTEELTKLKVSRDTMEQSLREKERNEHVYIREVTALKQETSRLIRNTTRENANLEYLKNIVLRYLRATSSSEKRQILLAIFTVLQFSDEEKNSVKHKLAKGWFS